MLNKLKDSGQDFEWYPTTEEMIDCIHKHITKDAIIEGKFYSHHLKSNSILDIGAGDGRVLSILEKKLQDLSEEHIEYLPTYTKYAIEKSTILCQKLIQDNIFVLGTDFHEQANLIDKPVDIVFCNPPYSSYVQWVIKILKESNTQNIYMVIPERWKSDEKIKDLMERRNFQVEVLGSFDFLNAERQARAKVDVLYFSKRRVEGPFSMWFEENFDIHISQTASSLYSSDMRKSAITKELTTKENLVKELIFAYKADMEKLLSSYKALEQVDPGILGELEVSLHSLEGNLKKRIEGLKSLYWKLLFENLSSLTDRLTSKSLEAMRDRLTAHTHIDFTVDNIYVIIIWAIENANKYYDNQMVDLYRQFVRKENIIPYKSNQRFEYDEWKFNRNEVEKISLDYRIVDHYFEAIKLENSWSTWDYEKGLKKGAHLRINDLLVVAKNLGFDVVTSSYDFDWQAGKKNFFYLQNGEMFADIKAFKNGNLHYKLNTKFMKKFNVEVSRILGWVKTPKEASEEFDVTFEEACEYFSSNIQIEKSDIKLISG